MGRPSLPALSETSAIPWCRCGLEAEQVNRRTWQGLLVRAGFVIGGLGVLVTAYGVGLVGDQAGPVAAIVGPVMVAVGVVLSVRGWR